MGNLSNEDIKQFLDVLFKRGFEKGAKKVINDAAKELVEKGREEDKKSISYEWQEPPHVFVPSYAISPFDYISDAEGSINKFNSLTSTAMERLMEILRETKNAMGSLYVPVCITSGLRTPKYHFQNVLENRLQNQNAYNYYLEQSGSNSLTTRYLKLVEYKLHKKELSKDSWVNITHMKEDIEKLRQGDFAEAERILIKLMEDWVIKGTDHREGGGVDLRNGPSYMETTTKLQEVATLKGYYNYGGNGKNKNGTPRNHMHITLIPLSRSSLG